MTLFDGVGPGPVPLAGQVEVAERELRYREWVYPKRVKEGKMAQRDADMQLAGMRAIIRTLRGILESGEQPPEPSRLKPGVLVELQTQAARGDILKRHVKDFLAALPHDVQLPVTAADTVKVLREAIRSMEKAP